MSAYDNDPRVTDVTGHAALYEVTCCSDDGPIARVRWCTDGTFTIFPDGADFVVDPVSFATADEAIRSLIGDPR